MIIPIVCPLLEGGFLPPLTLVSSRSLALAAYCCYRYRYCCWLLFCCSPLSTSSSTRFRAARSRALQASAIVSKTGKRSVGVDRKFALDPRPTVVLNLLTCSSSASPRLLPLDKGRSGPKTRGSTGFPAVRAYVRARALPPELHRSSCLPASER